MTSIYIDGKKAVLHENFSFEYNLENPDFSQSEGYTFNISLPLKGCPENIEIFGNLERFDSLLDFGKHACDIVTESISMHGVAIVTKIDSPNIEIQFLQGRCAQNFDTGFDEIFINELELGEPESRVPSANDADDFAGPDYFAYPWYNESSGLDVLENEMGNNGGASASWRRCTTASHPNNEHLSYQPRLYFVATRIFDAVGYTYSLDEWRTDELYDLIVCNALPSVWDLPQWARALPHWSVSEFIGQLELLLNGWFRIDHEARHVSFRFRRRDFVEEVKLDNVVDLRKVEVDESREMTHLDEVTISYADRDDDDWKFLKCEWLPDSMRKSYGIGVAVYDRLIDLVAAARNFREVYTREQRRWVHNIYHARDIDQSFILRKAGVTEGSPISSSGYTIGFKLQPINVFSSRNYESDSSDANHKSEELKIVPVRLGDLDSGQGKAIFLSPASYSEYHPDTNPEWTSTPILQDPQDWFPRPEDLIKHGETTKVPEYYDKIFVAYHVPVNLRDAYSPCPYVDAYQIYEDWVTKGIPSGSQWSPVRQGLRLDKRASLIEGIDFSAKISVKFLTKEILDAGALFYIRGKWHVCEKIKYTFTTDGLSELALGEFYAITD